MMVTNMMANKKRVNLEVGPTVQELAGKEKSELNLLTMKAEENSVYNVNKSMVWV